MSVAVYTTTTTPRVRRGPLLPRLLDAFPVPPNHSNTPSPSLSSPSPFPPPIGSPPRSPLPPIPSQQASTSTLMMAAASVDSPVASSVTGIGMVRPRTRTPAKVVARSISPTISAIIDKNLNSKSPAAADNEDSGNESGGSESSIDIHTPLPHLMVREGLLSPNSKTLSALSRTASPAMSRLSLISVETSTTNLSPSQIEERERRKRRHRNGKVLREGLGLTTGLGWSDSEDEDEDGRAALLHRMSTRSLKSNSAYPSSIRSAPPSSRSFSHTPSQLSRSTTASTTSNGSSSNYSAFSAQKPHSLMSRSQSEPHHLNTATGSSRGSTASTASDASSHSSFPSRSSGSLPRSKSARPSIPLTLASIGETPDKSSVDEFGQQSQSAVELDKYGRYGYNYSLPRSSSRTSMRSNTSLISSVSTSAPATPTSRTLRRTAPKNLPPPKSQRREEEIHVSTKSGIAASSGGPPKFRNGMDARVQALEERMQKLQDYKPPPLSSTLSAPSHSRLGTTGSDTERETMGSGVDEKERSRTPTPNSPGDSRSTDSASSGAMPLTPNTSESVSHSASIISQTSHTRTPSKIRPLITSSSILSLYEREGGEMGLGSTRISGIIAPRTIPQPRRPTASPATLGPASVEYAAHAQLHPLSSSSKHSNPSAPTTPTPASRMTAPSRVTSLHPLNYTRSAIPPPSAAAVSLSASPPARTGTGMTYRSASSGSGVVVHSMEPNNGLGSSGRLGSGKLGIKKTALQGTGNGIGGSGIGAGGVSRV